MIVFVKTSQRGIACILYYTSWLLDRSKITSHRFAAVSRRGSIPPVQLLLVAAPVRSARQRVEGHPSAPRLVYTVGPSF